MISGSDPCRCFDGTRKLQRHRYHLILKKQKQTVDGFRISIDGEREKGKEATRWKDVHIIFELQGNIDPEKAKRACASR